MVSVFGVNPIPAVIAVALTLILVIILALIIRIIIFVQVILGGSAPSSLPGIPSKPHLCFGPNTPINIVGKGTVPISEVKPGMKINDTKKSTITSVLKLSTDGQQIYKVYDKQLKQHLYVTGEHRIRTIVDGKYKWIPMKKNPNAVLVTSKEFEHLYCLNTSSKLVKIGEHWFKDWDDLHTSNYFDLQKAAYKYVFDKKMNTEKTTNLISPETIHPIFENGFHSSTLISLEDGSQVPIKNVEIGSVLKNGATVFGVVNIKNTFELKKYDTNLICTNGCYVRNGKKAIPINIYCREAETEPETLIKHNHRLNKPDHLWHLVTDLGFISCENMEILDYNYNIDIHL